ncbi:MAG TPA: S-4TM family putative pore-forming effector [Verrucomicrobiae bacterium]|nr:S-4TM family putative pore-forming effector [Verrucomicrobiae bacterium]
MAETITTRQNAPEEIKKLRAQRYLYGKAKIVMGLQAVLTVVFPVAGAIAELFWPSLKGGLAFYGIAISVLDIAVLEPLQKKMRTVAAKIQELFDCNVLNLGWDDIGVGYRPDEEDIHAASSAHRGGKEDPQLKDWYPTAVVDLPLSLGRIVCQRTNLRWDAALRRRYRTWLACILLILGATVAFIGFRNGASLEQLTVGVLAPIFPMFLWGIRQFQEQGEAADTSDLLREKSSMLWTAAIEKQLSDEELSVRSRQLQNAIFSRRSTAPMIFDWIYKLLRRSEEERMNVAAAEFVRQAKAGGF